MELTELKIVPQFERKRVCCFTGNRPHKLPWGENEDSPKCRAFRRRLDEELGKLCDEGYKLFISGMAQGGDIMFAEAVLALKKDRGIFLECAVPYRAQANAWSTQARRRYDDILEAADYVTFVSYEYTTSCLFRRNRYMVDKSSAIITLDYSSGGGTESTAGYAAKRGLSVIALGNK